MKAKPTLLQSLYTRNDEELLERIERANGWVSQIALHLKTPVRSRHDADKPIKPEGDALEPIEEEITPDYIVEHAYLRTLSRLPSGEERTRAIAYLEQAPNHAEGLRDLMWVLLNTQEFLTNH